jgi:hypothetical protein
MTRFHAFFAAALLASCMVVLRGQEAAPEEAPADPSKPKVRSPFLPRGEAKPDEVDLNQPTNTPLDQLEFRGIVFIGENRMFSVFDPSASRGYWLKPGASEAGYTLTTFDETAQAITIRSAAGVRSIPLKSTSPGGGNNVVSFQRPTPAPLVAPSQQPPPPGAAPMATSLPPGSFPIATGQPVPPGYMLAQPLPSTEPGALSPGVVYALPPGSAVPPGFAPVALPGAAEATPAPVQRRRIIVDPRQAPRR